jgi:hypothetical protein
VIVKSQFIVLGALYEWNGVSDMAVSYHYHKRQLQQPGADEWIFTASKTSNY